MLGNRSAWSSWHYPSSDAKPWSRLYPSMMSHGSEGQETSPKSERSQPVQVDIFWPQGLSLLFYAVLGQSSESSGNLGCCISEDEVGTHFPLQSNTSSIRWAGEGGTSAEMICTGSALNTKFPESHGKLLMFSQFNHQPLPPFILPNVLCHHGRKTEVAVLPRLYKNKGYLSSSSRQPWHVDAELALRCCPVTHGQMDERD